MIFNMTGTGNNPVNINVIGGTTRPNDPGENTFWVNTSTPISGWTFSENQPSNPTSGMIWFVEGNYSSVEINALKRNGIQLSPIYAKQFVTNKWTVVPCECYTNKEWVPLRSGELYAYGNECEVFTNGWKIVNAPSGVGKKKGNHIYLSYHDDDYGRDSCAYTNKKIDLTGYKRLKASFSIEYVGDDDYGVYLGVSSNNTALDFEGFDTYKKTSDSSKQELSLDLSAFQGKYYVALNGSVTDVLIYKVWAE